ncbi:MAG: PHP domain-containing protein, partial [Rikenellaceae bacterium]
MANFTHLHVHTQYSILDGASNVEKLLSRAKELGMDSLAITDHGNMFGVKHFHKAALKAGIKPILGCEAYVARRTRHDKSDKIDRSGYHLILLAKNLVGYKNLTKMVSYSWTEGEYYRPRIDKELLEKYHEGIICCSACLGGEVQQNILNGDIKKAEEAALWYKSLFGEDYY